MSPTTSDTLLPLHEGPATTSKESIATSEKIKPMLYVFGELALCTFLLLNGACMAFLSLQQHRQIRVAKSYSMIDSNATYYFDDTQNKQEEVSSSLIDEALSSTEKAEKLDKIWEDMTTHQRQYVAIPNLISYHEDSVDPISDVVMTTYFHCDEEYKLEVLFTELELQAKPTSVAVLVQNKEDIAKLQGFLPKLLKYNLALHVLLEQPPPINSQKGGFFYPYNKMKLRNLAMEHCGDNLEHKPTCCERAIEDQEGGFPSSNKWC